MVTSFLTRRVCLVLKKCMNILEYIVWNTIQYINTLFYILFEILCNTLFDIHLKYDHGHISYSYTMYMIYKGMIQNIVQYYIILHLLYPLGIIGLSVGPSFELRQGERLWPVCAPQTGKVERRQPLPMMGCSQKQDYNKFVDVFDKDNLGV